jgi:HEPN domain-containing protein
MTKIDHIEYWLKTSEDDWITVESLFQSGRYIHCLFFAHLSIEKICKALWVKYNIENIPPKIHNLVKILHGTNQIYEEKDLAFLEEFNDFQLEGRYPDYLFKINQICTVEFTTSILNKVKEIKKCLLKKLL